MLAVQTSKNHCKNQCQSSSDVCLSRDISDRYERWKSFQMSENRQIIYSIIKQGDPSPQCLIVVFRVCTVLWYISACDSQGSFHR